jgi:hypothetical protein
VAEATAENKAAAVAKIKKAKKQPNQLPLKKHLPKRNQLNNSIRARPTESM